MRLRPRAFHSASSHLIPATPSSRPCVLPGRGRSLQGELAPSALILPSASSLLPTRARREGQRAFLSVESLSTEPLNLVSIHLAVISTAAQADGPGACAGTPVRGRYFDSRESLVANLPGSSQFSPWVLHKRSQALSLHPRYGKAAA